jgi:hypothetical protein
MTTWATSVAILRDVVVIFGAIGAMAYWIDRFRFGPRLRIFRFEEMLLATDPHAWNIQFEVVNIGKETTSLDPTIRVRALSIVGERIVATGRIPSDAPRTLKPHESSTFQVSFNTARVEGKQHADAFRELSMSSYRVYRIATVRGRSAQIRVKEWMEQPELLGWFRFYTGRSKAQRKKRALWARLQGAADRALVAETEIAEGGGK